ncbi:transcriptional regulator (plasmid) [Bacillus badius]|uniref:transcriptional regulator n=1 Tax=Bacillus badius TaxID=1455 RepID=UPI001CBFB2CB|nr:transcriptional regulator [Bacillus badius]UAT33095.1 transcriptional regulator [Bacillus badius]
MTVSRMLSNEEFKQMMSYKPYANNHKEQQSMKLKLLKVVEEVYGDSYYRLKKETRQAIDMMCWLSSERGFFFAKDDYLADRHDISDRTIRNVAKKLREHGVLFSVYRRSTKQNGRSAPVHLFVDHPYFSYWEELLNLSDFQADFQTENAETPCGSKDEEAKKVPTYSLPLKKSFNKYIRKEEPVLDESFTPSHIPKSFILAVKPFFGQAKEIYKLWGKAMLAYRITRLNTPLEELTELVVQAFKESIFSHKHSRIKGSFNAYFFGTLRNMMTVEKRREIMNNDPIFTQFKAYMES